MKLLLHCCCGPCALGALPQYINLGYEPFGYFFNPNIHPYQEHRARRNAFRELMENQGYPYEIISDYPLEDWLCQVAPAPMERCVYCYETRLRGAAAFAADHGFESFSSTLLISPYQDHQLIRSIGEKMAVEYGLKFIYVDLRAGFRDGQSKARDLGLYMQKYCGCIYSEKLRYTQKKSKRSKA